MTDYTILRVASLNRCFYYYSFETDKLKGNHRFTILLNDSAAV